MLAMRRESDNNISGSNNSTTHSNYTATNIVPGDNNLTHLNYHHPVHGYSSATASYSGYQSNSKFDLITGSLTLSIFYTINVCDYFLDNRPTLSAQNNLDEYVDILQVQQILENRIQLENTTASASTTSTVPTASYTTSVISPSTATTSSASSSSAAAVTKNRPRVNLQKAAEYSAQVQGKLTNMYLIFIANVLWHKSLILHSILYVQIKL